MTTANAVSGGTSPELAARPWMARGIAALLGMALVCAAWLSLVASKTTSMGYHLPIVWLGVILELVAVDALARRFNDSSTATFLALATGALVAALVCRLGFS